MSRPPLRVPVERVVAGEMLLDADAARYVTRVHRLGVGEVIAVFDPAEAIEADAEILAIDRTSCRVRISATRPASVRATRNVTLIQAIGKGDKLDAIVRDATELGATRVIAAIAERSLSRPTETTRSARWKRIAIEAARQSGRGDAPSIEGPSPLLEILSAIEREPRGDRVALCLDPSSDAPLGAALRSLDARAAVVLLVGPEGGLADAELEAAERAGFVRVTLGSFVLRTETVCAAVLGALLALTDPLRTPGPTQRSAE